MKLEKYFKFFLIDGESGVTLLRDVDRDICSFVSSCILDSSVTMLDEKTFKYEQSLHDVNKWVIYKPWGWFAQNVNEIEPHVIEKKKRALLLADGYKLLLYKCELTLHKFDHVALISQRDVDLCINNRDSVVSMISTSLDIPVEETEKQLYVEMNDLLAVRLREIELRIRFGSSLREVKTAEDLAAWKSKLFDATDRVCFI